MDIAKRILVVDNELRTVTAAINCLEDAGYRTDCVEDGQIAWNILNEKPNTYSAIIVNRTLPNINGLELLTKIKGSSKLHNIPVIIETITENPDDYLEALDNGASDYIYKPLENEFLLYVVDNAVNQSIH